MIDNIYFNFIEHFAISGNIMYERTDHSANFIVLSNFFSFPPNTESYQRDYHSFDESSLVNEVQSIDWYDIFSYTTNLSDMFDFSYYTISSIKDENVP